MTFSQEVVGEAYYQDTFEKICGPRCEDGENLDVPVVLVPETANPFDSNAVAVTVRGLTVGYLPKDDSVMYRQLFATRSVECSGKIVGGWEREDSQGHYGIRLDLTGVK